MATPNHITIIPIRLPIVRAGTNLGRLVANSLSSQEQQLETGDVLAIASKIVSICERRIIRLSEVQVTTRARMVANRWAIDPRLVAVVMKETNEIIGGVRGFLLTVNHGILTPNAGVDLKNSPRGTATLWPANPDRSARRLRLDLEHRCKRKIGVVVIDSHITPLRLGTVGLAIGVSGFVPVEDYRGDLDVFGRSIRVTQSNVADDIASAAHLLMGESAERIGAVLIRTAPIKLRASASGATARLSRAKCLVGSSLPHSIAVPRRQ